MEGADSRYDVHFFLRVPQFDLDLPNQQKGHFCKINVWPKKTIFRGSEMHSVQTSRWFWGLPPSNDLDLHHLWMKVKGYSPFTKLMYSHQNERLGVLWHADFRRVGNVEIYRYVMALTFIIYWWRSRLSIIYILNVQTQKRTHKGFETCWFWTGWCFQSPSFM